MVWARAAVRHGVTPGGLQRTRTAMHFWDCKAEVTQLFTALGCQAAPGDRDPTFLSWLGDFCGFPGLLLTQACSCCPWASVGWPGIGGWVVGGAGGTRARMCVAGLCWGDAGGQMSVLEDGILPPVLCSRGDFGEPLCWLCLGCISPAQTSFPTAYKAAPMALCHCLFILCLHG